MKRILRKLSILTILTTLSFTVLAGCGNNNNNTPDNNTTKEANESKMSGSITMAGSTSMEKFSTALSEAFMEKNSGITINAEYIGSSAGIEALIGGSAQIGNASRALKDSEIQEGVVSNVVAIDGIAIITDTSNKITDLTTEELTKIYSGEIKNWSELGGDNMPIVVVGREAGSGTRGAFEELLKLEDQCAYANELDSTGAVMAKVASTKGAIGYVSLDVLDDTVIAVNLNGVAPSEDAIKSGDYMLSRPFVMATMGDISEQSPEIQELFNYIHSDEGKTLIESVGLITAD